MQTSRPGIGRPVAAALLIVILVLAAAVGILALSQGGQKTITSTVTSTTTAGGSSQTSSSSSASQTSSSSSATGVPGTITMDVGVAPRSLDPASITDSVSEIADTQIYEELFFYNGTTQTIIPWL